MASSVEEVMDAAEEVRDTHLRWDLDGLKRRGAALAPHIWHMEEVEGAKEEDNLLGREFRP